MRFNEKTKIVWLDRTAWIDAEDSSSWRPCKIEAISADVMTIVTEDGEPLPEEFCVRFTKRGKPNKRCRAISQDGGKAQVVIISPEPRSKPHKKDPNKKEPKKKEPLVSDQAGTQRPFIDSDWRWRK